MQRVIVSGATGGIGLALVEKLLESGKEVVALVRPGSRRTGRLPRGERLRIVEQELEDISALPDRVGAEGPYDAFYHLAWDHSREHDDVKKQFRNVGCTLGAIAAADRLGCACFIGAGSQAEYGLIDGTIDESTLPSPVTAYGAAKLAAGQIGRIDCEQRGLRFVWPRIFSVYGPGDGDATVVMSVIRQLLAGKTPALTAGEQLWDFLYVSDAATALQLLGETEACAGIYCVGNGTPRRLRLYLEELRDEVNPIAGLDFGAIPYGAKQTMCLAPDIAKLCTETGFRPAVEFSAGIRSTIRWCREHPDVVLAGYGAGKDSRQDKRDHR